MSTRSYAKITCTGVRRRLCRYGASAALAALCLVGLAGCSDDEVNRQFRAAAISSIESGVKSIADGVITGIFTVADPTENASASSTTGG